MDSLLNENYDFGFDFGAVVVTSVLGTSKKHNLYEMYIVFETTIFDWEEKIRACSL